jgi:hypothetical protein
MGAHMRISNILFLLMLCASVAACGGKKTEAPKPKTVEKAKQPVESEKAPAETAQKDDAPTEKAEPLNEEDARTILVGIWRVDVKSLGKAPPVDPLADDETAARAVERQALAMTAFEFSPEGRFTQFMGQQIFRGKYKVEKATGDVLHILTTVEGRQTKMRVKVSEENLVLKQRGVPTLTLERGPPKIMGVAP